MDEPAPHCRAGVWARGRFRLVDGTTRVLTVRGEAYATLDEAYTEQDALAAFTSGLMATSHMLAPSGECGILVELLACGFGRR